MCHALVFLAWEKTCRKANALDNLLFDVRSSERRPRRFLSRYTVAKALRRVASSDTQRALSAVDNAVWDLTLATHWADRVTDQLPQKRFWVLCSRDNALAKNLLFSQEAGQTRETATRTIYIALDHGFVLDDSLADHGLVTGDGMPWEDVQASRRNRYLQGKHPVTEGKNRYLEEATPCPKCQALPSEVIWFYFHSPKETWPALCGVAGWMAVCDRCHVQVNFFSETMN
jgi:hypothetical protein